MSHMTIVVINMNTDKTMNPREGRKPTKGHTPKLATGYEETWAFWSHLRALCGSDSAHPPSYAPDQVL